MYMFAVTHLGTRHLQENVHTLYSTMCIMRVCMCIKDVEDLLVVQPGGARKAGFRTRTHQEDML